MNLAKPDPDVVDIVAVAIAEAADAAQWIADIADWENAADYIREAFPEDRPTAAYEERDSFRRKARSALSTASARAWLMQESSDGVSRQDELRASVQADNIDAVKDGVSRLGGMRLMRRYSLFDDQWWDKLYNAIARVALKRMSR